MAATMRKPAPDARFDPAAYWRDRPCLAVPGVAGDCGRGLFALTEIPAGALIERACTIEISRGQCPVLDAIQPLGDFYFEHPEDPQAGLMALGLMSLCNHSEQPNADIRFVAVLGLGWMAELAALAPISRHAEITYRYKCPLWFPEA